MRSKNTAVGIWTEEIGTCGCHWKVKCLEEQDYHLLTIPWFAPAVPAWLVKWLLACHFILKSFPIWISYMITLGIFKFMNFKIVYILVFIIHWTRPWRCVDNVGWSKVSLAMRWQGIGEPRYHWCEWWSVKNNG